MIDWKQVKECEPDNGRMILACNSMSRVSQLYYYNGLFHDPWGEVLPEIKQPKWWAELNWPIMNGSGEEA